VKLGDSRRYGPLTKDGPQRRLRAALYPLLGLAGDAARVSGINFSTVFWYASRATGVVALLLLTAVMVLGVLVAQARYPRLAIGPAWGRPPGTQRHTVAGLPRFAATGLHRNLSLLATVFVLVHVVTAVLDGYVNIPLAAAVVPLTSPYERFWLGLGAVSLDLMLAAAVTSLLRRHLSRRVWRAVHLTAYLSWPVAWAHSVFAGGDLRSGWLLALGVACAAAVAGAAGWRLAAAARDVPRADRVERLMSAAADSPQPRRAPRREPVTAGERMQRQ
jgi:sulfoxide reductase heme-binding subunit YedZ